MGMHWITPLSDVQRAQQLARDTKRQTDSLSAATDWQAIAGCLIIIQVIAVLAYMLRAGC